jgi:hypothetical protein
MSYMGFIFLALVPRSELEWLPSSGKLFPLPEPDPSEYRQKSPPHIYLRYNLKISLITFLLMVAWSFIGPTAGSSGVAKIAVSSAKVAVVLL